MEQPTDNNRQLALDKNELQLDSEPEEAEPILIDKPKSSEPIEFRECIKFQGDNFSCEVYSSSVPVDSLASIVLWLKLNVVEDKKQSGGYLG